MTFDIIIDFDDVLYPWSATAHTIAERAGITNGKVITQWLMHKDYGCDPAVLWDVLGAATLTGELHAARPIDGTIMQLRRLRNFGNRVHIVTARGFGQHGELVKTHTREYIAKWGVPYDSITFTKDKSEVAADFALDDGPHNYEQLDAAGVHVVLMNAIHNQPFSQLNGQPVRRVDTVREFVDMVLAIQGAQTGEEYAA